MKPTLVVLAAGMGSRFGGSKQVAEMGPSGETIMEYSIYDAINAGFGKVVFIVREHMEELMKSHFYPRLEGKIEVDLAFQELDFLPEGYQKLEDRTKPWGTGHAVMMAKDVVGEPFAVINADDFYGAESFQIIADYLKNLDNDSSDYCMVGFHLSQTLSDHGGVSRGICYMGGDMKLDTVEEHMELQRAADGVVRGKDEEGNEKTFEDDTIVSMNFWGFSPKFFEQLDEEFTEFLDENIKTLKKEFYIPLAINNKMNVDECSVKVLPSKNKWFGVTYKEDKEFLQKNIQKLVEEGVYPSNLWA